jgi:HAD superfamily hydrolase (TIGR01509 family)
MFFEFISHTWRTKNRIANRSNTNILFDEEIENGLHEANRLKLAELGIALAKDDYLRDMASGVSAWERAVAAGISNDEIEMHKAGRNDLYQGFLQHSEIEIDGVESVLEQLSKNYAMAIVTTSRKADFELIHRDRNICRYMSFVLTKGDYKQSKPHPHPYLTALERFNASKDETVVVEDSERGLRAAVAAGIDCIVVKNDFVRGQDLSTATHRIETLSMLQDLLREM